MDAMRSNEQENKYELLVDPVSYKDRPKPKGSELGAIRSRLADPSSRLAVTKQELVNIVSNGQTIMPAVCVGGTKTGNWLQQQIFVLDFDNDDAMRSRGYQVLNPDDALARAFDNGYEPLLLYFTHSATVEPWNPRYRLVFGLDKPIADRVEAALVITKLLNAFPEADPSSKQLVHMYLSPGGEIWPC